MFLYYLLPIPVTFVICKCNKYTYSQKPTSHTFAVTRPYNKLIIRPRKPNPPFTSRSTRNHSLIKLWPPYGRCIKVSKNMAWDHQFISRGRTWDTQKKQQQSREIILMHFRTALNPKMWSLRTFFATTHPRGNKAKHLNLFLPCWTYSLDSLCRAWSLQQTSNWLPPSGCQRIILMWHISSKSIRNRSELYCATSSSSFSLD